ncbi:putative Cysteine-rich RLK (RECEPTOR-like protein kinase) 8 [Hibiscus syriacus]|uniref:Cysteine-rich RLK (RECEPTOR-like protein kinase) 8 n=1 Tax=Hibiscus syriacus TaxID=106335 RepID=A0A6A3AFN3_HIBSY|nr:putative Cysteine-rich RLK (RECEPTOR-like protein kinase) 8 [Hibiscus syriacus]
MEVRVSSRETIRPDSNEAHLQKPFNISFLDQLIPPVYVPGILFFNGSTADTTQISSLLKKSLSKTLNQFYPLSGRTIHNLCIDYYEEGVPFIEARVNGCLSDYLEAVELERLNQLLPLEPFRHLSGLHPLLAVQFNVFDCGGIALALCCSHKMVDSSTVSAFLKSWSAFARGTNGEIPRLHLLEASSRFFPTRDWISPDTLSSLKRVWFKEGKYKTRSFVFDANAVKTLMFKAKTKNLEHPSRAETLTAFIWKHAMLASRSTSGIVKPSVIIQAVNMRRKMKQPLPDYSIGNLFWFATTTYNNSADKDTELHELAYIATQSVENFDTEGLQGDEGFKVISEQIKQLSEVSSNENVDLYGFSSWLNSAMHQVDFGWGMPSWLGIPGLVAPALNNFTFRKRGRK